MKTFIHQIWINKKVLNHTLTKRVLQNRSKRSYQMTNDKEAAKRLQTMPLNKGKRILYLTLQKGEMVKPCPGTSPPYLCCKYTVINQLNHCPMDCTYCILQMYLDSPVITLYTNLPAVFKQIDSMTATQPKRLVRFGTGEMADSLALDHLTELSADYVKYFSKKKNTLFELKTKTSHIDHLLTLQPKNTVVSWSLNPQPVIDKEENLSATLSERLRAAQKCMEAGYLLGFHFDPILYMQNWEFLYRELVHQLFTYVDGSRIVWISLGSLRYPSPLMEIIRKRFPKSRIIYEEMIRGLDGKMRYPKPMRIAMYRKLFQQLREKDPDLFIYFCMEPPDVWDKVMGTHPESNEELDFWFARSAFKRFPKLNLIKPKMEYYR